jgi:LPS O-antigen subunit length determinant protein (WzzB/FepE family)
MTDILMEKNMESQTKETDVAINFITEQLGIYKRKTKESEIATLEDQLKVLLQDSTEQHPMVKDLREKINIAKKELEDGNYEVKNPDQPVSDTTKQALQLELDKIITQETQAATTGAAPESQTDPNTAIYKLMLMDKVDQATAKDTNVNEAIYSMLLQKLETAKMTQRLEASREGTRYTIIEPARLPLRPIKPNKPLVILIGLLLGAAAGVGVVFAREFLDQSILDIEDAKLTLDLPVLGAISRITTQEEIDREKRRAQLGITVGVIITVVILVTGGLISLFAH